MFGHCLAPLVVGIGSVQERSTARTDACDRMILVVRQYQLGA